VTVVVLLKAVPALEELAFDPTSKTVRRDAAPLRTNPCDARALTTALLVRRTGEPLVVLSLGPPSAQGVLREALELGADRAVHLSDPAFAGSDVLVTSDLLARALRRLAPELVLAGRSTTDSETGLVGPEVAARLGWAHVGPARSISVGEGSALEVVTDTEGGTATFALERPAVISVGEKIGKPGKVTPEGRARAEALAVETWDAAALALGEAEVGRTGSPTVVEEVRFDAPTRANLRIDTGTPSEKARSAVDRLRPLLARSSYRPAPAARPAHAEAEEGLVLVSDEEGRLTEDALPLLSELRRAGSRAVAVWIGPGPSGADLARIARAGGQHTLVAPAPAGWIDPSVAAGQLDRLLALRAGVGALLFPATEHGRSVAAFVAVARGLGIVADALRLEADGGSRRWEKPAFGRSYVAAIRCRTRPEVVTVRPGAFSPWVLERPPAMGMTRLEVAADPARVIRRLTSSWPDRGWGILETARVVVVAGMGLGGPERLADLAPALAAWGAALGATRRAVDAGWMPPSRQIGLTGRSLSPDLAILLGVRGSTHHLVGLSRARAILAVNTDPEAPALASSDVGIVGDWSELLPELVPALRSALADASG
jgi:electron transfer flavoprotein alpha subunit